ncbi:hypothetical protein PCNPT3_08365 [Psychromonas sp. CNPT3]|nr:hypothetical protein PCNPT3_08365 [Psychromonas sp. CNPT3]
MATATRQNKGLNRRKKHIRHASLPGVEADWVNSATFLPYFATLLNSSLLSYAHHAIGAYGHAFKETVHNFCAV